MCVLMPHGSDVLRDSFGAVVDVLSLFWGWLLLTVALGLYLVFGVVYNAEVIVRVSQIFLFGKERGTHFSSEPTWSVPEFWAGVKEKVQIPCTQGSSAEPGSEDIDPSEGSRPPTPGVLSSLWFCDLGFAGSSEQGTQSLERPTGAQLVVLHFEALVMKFCLILCQKWILCRWLSSFPCLIQDHSWVQHGALGQCSLCRTFIAFIYLSRRGDINVHGIVCFHIWRKSNYP